MRAVAVLLVVWFHIDPALVGGGRVGVDVFFVFSGFVITGVLIRERTQTGATGLLPFYGHRARRIIPMAALVIVVAVVAERALVGGNTASLAAVDGRWAAVFLGNVRMAEQFPTYLTPRPGSPFQTFWSLAVEEQFYLIYPVLFLALATFGRRWSLRVKLGISLSAIIAISFAWSVYSTSPTQLSAYYSTLTRAWELAIGGLVAVLSGPARRLPSTLAAAMTWLGLVAIVATAFALTATAPLPGAVAGIPVCGTALMLAGGAVASRYGAVLLLKVRPLQTIGRWSYSFYLWQWPLLLIAAQHWGTTSASDRWLLSGLALVLAGASYHWIETPTKRFRVHGGARVNASMRLGLGALLIGICLVVAS